jgi:hypothetical protein
MSDGRDADSDYLRRIELQSLLDGLDTDRLNAIADRIESLEHELSTILKFLDAATTYGADCLMYETKDQFLTQAMACCGGDE